MPTIATLLAAALLALPAAAPPPAPAHPGGCQVCGDTGLVECKKCRRKGCARADEVRFCSLAVGCEPCAGTRTVACGACEAPAPEHEERVAAARAWLAQVREIDAYLDEELHHTESAHFRLTFGVRRIDLGRDSKPHEAMHVYLERLEALFARFVADVAADPNKDFFDRTQVMLFDRATLQERASLRYTHQESSTQSKLMGASPVVCIHYDKNHLHEEFELHQAMVHQVAHCLLSNVFDGIWPGNIGGGWIDAGLAHYYEVALFGSVRHYCYVEADTMRHFEFGRWEPAVRAAVGRGKALPFLQVTGRNTNDLTPEQHMYAWSFVDFVLRRHPGRFGALARGLKQKQPLVKALGDALGLTPFELERDWSAFVMAEYSLQKK